MDWPTAIPVSVSIIMGVTAFTKIITTRNNTKEYKSHQTVIECNRKHDILSKDIKEIKKDITTIKVDIGKIIGRMEE